jgi:hypothetical protein
VNERSVRGTRTWVPTPIAAAFALAGALALMTACPAGAQDFALPRVTPLSAAGAMLEDALPPAGAQASLAAGTIAWYGVPELATRAILSRIGWRTWRGALGVSQTGDAELGWTTLALAAGAAGSDWGVACRVLARRDRTTAFEFGAAPGEGGLATGAGAWLALGAAATVWASAPDLAATGAEPPLARPLEAGLEWRAAGLTLWLARRSAPPAYGGATLAAGVAAPAGPACVWLAAHDAPLSGSLGVALTHAGLGVQAEVESHPWLAPTARLAVVLASPP